MNVGVNAVVIGQDGRVLLIRRSDVLTWALPGGALDPGELPPEGVVRETEEETGLQVVPECLTGLYYMANGNSPSLLFTFRCRPVRGELQTTEEAIQVGYFRPDRLPWPFHSLHRQPLVQALHCESGPPHWGRQRPSIGLDLARRTIGPLIYRWLDFRLWWRNLPPYEPPRPWDYGAFVIIRDEEDRVLWVKRTDHDVWNLPGGGPETGETPWETAVREAREETGLTVRLTGLSGVYLKPVAHSMIFTFLAEVVAGHLTTGPEAAAFDHFAVGQEPQNSLPKQVERAADAAGNQGITLFRFQAGPPGLATLGSSSQ